MIGSLLLLTALPSTPVEVSPRVYEAVSKPQQARGIRVGFGIGRYTPDIDSEFAGGATPYDDIMGGGSWMLRPKVGWVLPMPFGELSLNGSVGWFSVTGTPILEATGEASGGTTSLRLIPVTGTVGLRTDLVERWLRFPVHPYLELGGSYTFWRSTKSDGRVSETDDARGEGGSASLVAALGVALALDRFDAQSRRALEHGFGIYGTDLFFEWRMDRTVNLIGGSPLRVGDSTWQAGLQLLF